MALSDWSTTPINNSTKPGINWAEGQTPDSINNSARQMMADLAVLTGSSGSSLLGYINAGVGAVFRYIQDRLRETVSVKDFGAKGDGITDDRAAIMAAYGALVAAGGGRLVFPKGTFLITDTLVFNSIGVDITIAGVSKLASQIMLTSAVAKNVVYIGSGVSESGRYTVRDIGIGVAQGAGANLPGNTAIYLDKRPQTVIQNVAILTNYVGILLAQSFKTTIDKVNFEYCGGSGVYFSDASSNGSVVRDCTFNGVGIPGNGAGISVLASLENEALLVDGCSFEGCYVGFLCFGSTSLRMCNSYVENSTSSNFYISGNNYAMTFENNWFGASPSSTVQNVTGMRFTNNTVCNTTVLFDTGATAKDVIISGTRLMGTGAVNPNVSATDDHYSTSKGFGIPAMTTAQKTAMTNLRGGLVVFDTTLGKLCIYTGAAWQTVTSV